MLGPIFATDLIACDRGVAVPLVGYPCTGCGFEVRHPANSDLPSPEW